MRSAASSHRYASVIVVLAIFMLASIGCGPGDDAVDTPAETAAPVRQVSSKFSDITQCPEQWTPEMGVEGELATENFALVAVIVDVPEFHDCQKLLTNSGTTYGPLAAIFAAWELESIEHLLDTLTRRSDGRPVAAAGALIVNFGAQYSVGDFVIAPGFSCLYLWRDGRWRASIVAVENGDLCRKPILPDTFANPNPVLRVLAQQVPDHSKDDYPAVARWDYDDASGQQYIGIKCGAAWCEIGSTNFASTPAEPGPGDNPGQKRVRRIKGWYDQQFLAVMQAGTPVPSRLRGTLFPHPELDAFAAGDFENKWPTVSYVALDGDANAASQYKAKLNLEPVSPRSPLESMNRIEMCHGSRAGCAVAADAPACEAKPLPPEDTVPWWGRVVSVSNQVRYFCVTRDDHSNHTLPDGTTLHVPGSARWRWILNDETTWSRCIEGCCELDALSAS